MRYVQLGDSGIEVSALCLGGMSFGLVGTEKDVVGHQWTIGAEETREVIAAALESGINFIDTANVYAGGTSEELIGQALRDLGVEREKVVLASKVFFNEGGLSAQAIKREIEGSLRRLGTDYLDLYIIHRFDYDTPIEETMAALHQLVEAGKVRALGASEMYAYQFHTMQNFAYSQRLTPFSSMQCHYNLVYREDEREMLPLCRQLGVLPTPYSPLASGILARPGTWAGSGAGESVRATTDNTMKNKYAAASDKDAPVVAAVEQIAAERGVTMAQVALAWHWAHGASSPIVGCSNVGRVREAAGALELELSEAELEALESPYVAHELVGPRPRPGERGNTKSTSNEKLEKLQAQGR